MLLASGQNIMTIPLYLRTIAALAILSVAGCVADHGRRLFFPTYRHKTLETRGQFRSIFPFDCNGDGHSDLLLVGAKDILCFLGNCDGLEDTAKFSWNLPEEIRYFDVVRSPAGDSVWVAAVTAARVVLFQDPAGPSERSRGTAGKTMDERSGDAFFPPLGRLHLFYHLDDDDVPDLVIPFKSRSGWQARLYPGNSSRKVTLDLGNDRQLFPPRLYCWQTGEILAEGSDGLMLYCPTKDRVYPDTPSPVSCGQSRLMGIAQLNAEGHPDLVMGRPDQGKMWIWIEKGQVYPLETSEVLHLGVDFQDCDRDGWDDIVCATLKDIHWSGLFFPYLVERRIPVTFAVYVFWNRHGRFFSDSFRVFERTLWLSLQNGPVPASASKVVEDIDDDGLIDAVLLDDDGKLSYYYDVCRFADATRPIDRLDYLLRPVYSHLISRYWPRRDPDFALSIESPRKYRRVSNAVLYSPGQERCLVFHYKAFSADSDLIVVVSPVVE